jgi:hypothetical protein
MKTLTIDPVVQKRIPESARKYIEPLRAIGGKIIGWVPKEKIRAYKNRPRPGIKIICK